MGSSLFVLWALAAATAGVTSLSATEEAVCSALKQSLSERRTASVLPETLLDAAVALARLGDSDGALELLSRVPRQSPMCSMSLVDYAPQLREIALSLARQGDFPPALQLIDKLAGIDHREAASALVYLSAVARRSGQRQLGANALRQARNIADKSGPLDRAMILLAIANEQGAEGQVQAANGRAAQAACIIQKDVRRSQKARALAELAATYARLGQEELKVRAVSDVKATFAAAEYSSGWYPDLVADTARSLCRAIPYADVISIVDGLKAATPAQAFDLLFDKSTAYSAIAHLAVVGGDLEAAREACRLVRGQEERWQCVAEIAASYARRGDVQTALQVAGEESDDWTRARAHLLIATVLAERGDKDDAVRLADEIKLCTKMGGVPVPVAGVFSWRLPCTWAMDYSDAPGASTLLSTDVPMGADFAAAAMIFEQTIGQPPRRDYAAAFSKDPAPVLRAVARAHALVGDPAQALSWARKLPAGNRRVWAILGVAEALSLAETLPEFVQTQAPPVWLVTGLRGGMTSRAWAAEVPE